MQQAVALTQAEIGLEALTRPAMEAIGIKSLPADFGVDQSVLHSGASAAVGLTQQRGAGKVRHLWRSRGSGSRGWSWLAARSGRAGPVVEPMDLLAKHVCGLDRTP